MASAASRRVLPGFGLTLGYTLGYLSLIVLVPLAAVLLKAATLTWPHFWSIVTAPRALASYRLSFGAALLAAAHQRGVRPDARLVAWCATASPASA